MIDTAAGDDLTRRAAENGVNRSAATFAVRKGLFNAPNLTKTDVPIGARFGAEGIIYTVTKKKIAGEFELTCETAGAVGNRYFGAILPIDSVQNIGTATLTDVLVSGEETETDEQLRTRYYSKVNKKAFGGNVAQYEQELLALDGVGGAAVFPTPGEQGGRVHCVIVAPGNKPVSGTLLAAVQTAIDPEPRGKGYGIAPCCHYVTISTVTERAVSVSASIAPARDYTIPALQAEIERVIADYLVSIAFRDNVVRISKIEAEIMGGQGRGGHRGNHARRRGGEPNFAQPLGCIRGAAARHGDAFGGGLVYSYIEYLPAYLREIRELKAVGQCADPPVAALEEQAKAVYADQLVATAGVEAVARLETVYRLPHRSDLPLSARRQQILARKASTQDLTKKYIQELAQSVTGEKCRVDIDFSIPKMDVVLVQNSLTPPDVALLARTIDEQKPANMLHTITVEQPLSGAVYVGAALLDGEILTIRQVV